MESRQPLGPKGAAFMPKYLTLSEAADWLSNETASVWTESALLGFAAEYHIALHAAPPIDARAAELELLPGGRTLTIRPLDVGGMKLKMPGQWRMAVVHPYPIAQLWLTGESKVSHAVKTSLEDGDAMVFFHDEVGNMSGIDVTMKNIRVSRQDLQNIISRYRSMKPAPANEPAARPTAAPGTAEPLQDAAPTESPHSASASTEAGSAPAVKASTAGAGGGEAPGWAVKPRDGLKFYGYRDALYAYLEMQHKAGRPKPTAADFLEYLVMMVKDGIPGEWVDWFISATRKNLTYKTDRCTKPPANISIITKCMKRLLLDN